MAEEQPNPADSIATGQERNTVAVTVLIVSGGGIILFAMFALYQDPKQAMNIFNSLWPVLGTWVGTVLAYYFSRQNFIAASQSVTELARQVSAPAEPAGPRYVKDTMIPLKSMVVYLYDDDRDNVPEEIPKKIGIEKLISICNASGKTRLPVIDRQKRPIYLIQRKEIDKHWAFEVATPTGTLQDMFDKVPHTKERFSVSTGFVIVKPDATLAEAKQKMEALPDCTDVLVTGTGTADDAVIGWLTDSLIGQSARF
jgi:hypothetical protein